MNKLPLVIIGIFLITAIFIAIFSKAGGDDKNPLAILGNVTPTPVKNIQNNSSISPTPQQLPIFPLQSQQQQQGSQPGQPSPTPEPIVPVTATGAVIHTVKGDIEMVLYPEDAPKTVINFATLSKYGYYNNLTFHRVEPGFVIQGGDPNGNGSGGISIYGPTFEDELIPGTASYKEGYKEGVVAMANRGPNTNGSQFFIMLSDTDLTHNYTIFGKVTKGLDIVHQIAKGDKMTTIELQGATPATPK